VTQARDHNTEGKELKMAKEVTSKPAASPFKIETGVALPAITRLGGGGQPSPLLVTMKALAAPVTDAKGNTKYQSFVVPVGAVPATITDPKEQAKYVSGEQRKIANRASSAARRISKDDKTFAFAVRAVNENGAAGVRIFRVAPKAE